MKRIAVAIVTVSAALGAQFALAGPLDPDCTPEKAVKSATAKATVGVGGRCDPKEAAADSAKRATGVADRGPIEQRRDDDRGADAVRGAVKSAVK